MIEPLWFAKLSALLSSSIAPAVSGVVVKLNSVAKSILVVSRNSRTPPEASLTAPSESLVVALPLLSAFK